MRASGSNRSSRVACLALATFGSLALAGCSAGAGTSGNSQVPSAGGESSMPGGELTPGTAAGSPGACEAASPAVLAVLRDGIAVRGATLSNVFAVRAGAAEGVAGWWVAGKLSGAGVAPEVVVWVVTGIDNLKADGVVAANAAAARSSRWTLPDGEDLTGAGRDAAVACVGPMPPA